MYTFYYMASLAMAGALNITTVALIEAQPKSKLFTYILIKIHLGSILYVAWPAFILSDIMSIFFSNMPEDSTESSFRAVFSWDFKEFARLHQANDEAEHDNEAIESARQNKK